MSTIHPNSLKNLTYKFPKGNVPWNKKKRISKECEMCFTRYRVTPYRASKSRFCSKECLGIFNGMNHTGQWNANWIGGAWLTVRRQILIEQDYTCQNCGHREPEIMEVNHKVERSTNPELSRDKSNMEVLCPNCHRRKTNAFLKLRANQN